ncbi:MAG: hypothetical protein PHS86_14025 [Syntrophaceae bacterium]|nr:hypothetical protein [Syntrophaceae bacterium]
MTILEPANVPLAGVPAPSVALIVLIASLSFFAYVMWKRIDLLKR